MFNKVVISFVMVISGYFSQVNAANSSQTNKKSEKMAVLQNQLNNPAGGIAWVGTNSTGCTHSTIQSAIDDPAINYIKLATNVTENILINKSLTLLGGFGHCGATQGTGIQSIIYGDNNLAPTITITQSGGINPTPNSVLLVNLYVTDGYGGITYSSSGGGLHILGGSQEVTLWQVDVASNTSANAGGGLSVENGAQLILLDSPVYLNTAINSGGGIYCSRSTITALGSSAIAANEVQHINSRGGGIYSVRCNINYHANETTDGFFQLNGIMNNKAKLSGAGIYAIGEFINTSGSEWTLYDTDILLAPDPIGNPPFASNIAPVRIVNNQITGTAGSNVSAISSSAPINEYCNYDGNDDCGHVNNLEMQNVEISGNTGATNVIYLGLAAELNMHCDDYQQKICNSVHSNTSSGSGNTVFLYSTNTLHKDSDGNPINHKLSGTEIYNNTAKFIIEGYQNTNTNAGNETDNFLNSNWQSAFRTGRSIIYDNNNLHNIGVAHGRTDMYFSHVTIANNNYVSTGSALFNNGLADGTQPNSTFNVVRSILDVTSANAITEGSDNIILDCVLRTAAVALAPTTITRQLISPQSSLGFIDPLNGDYHLQPTSPAVDFCDFQAGFSNIDMDGEITGYNSPVPNLYGSHDLGPDEFYPVVTGSANLSINMQISPGPYVEGDNLTAQFVITNAGPDPANNINIDMSLNNISVQQISINDGSCNGSQDHCEISLVNVNSSVSLTVVMSPDSDGFFNLFIQTQADENDPEAANNFTAFSSEALPFDLIFKGGFE